MLNVAVVRPIPSANASTAMAERPGARARKRGARGTAGGPGPRGKRRVARRTWEIDAFRGVAWVSEWAGRGEGRTAPGGRIFSDVTRRDPPTPDAPDAAVSGAAPASQSPSGFHSPD